MSMFDPNDLQKVGDAPPMRDVVTEDDVKEAAPNVKSTSETNLIVKALTKTYTGMALGLSMFAPADAHVIAKNAENMAESWRTLLDNDPKLRKRMKKFTESSGWGSVIAAHGIVGMAIMKNHEVNFGHLIKPKSKESREVSDRTVGRT